MAYDLSKLLHRAYESGQRQMRELTTKLYKRRLEAIEKRLAKLRHNIFYLPKGLAKKGAPPESNGQINWKDVEKILRKERQRDTPLHTKKVDEKKSN